MPFFTPQELAQWCHGEWVGTPPARIFGVIHDTRRIRPGELYVALRGERYDGHDFVEEAMRAGAAGALVARQAAAGLAGAGPLLVVEETRRALNALARGHRDRIRGVLIAVTGSVGKTTVKEMTADALARGGPTARTWGNWNNDIGLPISLLRMEPEDRYGVFEIGMNHPGELAALCAILRPHWAIVNPVGPVHTEFFGSVEAVAREKATVLEALPRDGVAVLGADDAWFELFRARAPCRVVTVSLQGRAADYEGEALGDGERALRVRERATGLIHVYPMPLPGGYVMRNAINAIAVARECGIAPAAIAEALRAFRPPPLRWNELTREGVLFINDAYNANPVSMREALKTFSELRVPGRKWLVLGGMRELGALTVPEHQALGREIAYGKWAGLIAVGELARGIAEGARSEGWPEDRLVVCPGPSQAAGALRERVAAGDAVLLKGSRAERMEQVLEAWDRLGPSAGRAGGSAAATSLS